MKTDFFQTGYPVSNSIYDTTTVVNPFFQTTSSKDSLIDQMKNSTIIIGQ